MNSCGTDRTSFTETGISYKSQEYKERTTISEEDLWNLDNKKAQRSGVSNELIKKWKIVTRVDKFASKVLNCGLLLTK